MLKRKREAEAAAITETVAQTYERLSGQLSVDTRSLQKEIAAAERKIRVLEERIGDGINPFESLRDFGVALARPSAGEHAGTIRIISGGTWVCDACGAESADLDLIGEIDCTENN